MLITDESLLEHIRARYKGFGSYIFKDASLSEEKEFVVVRDLYEANETAINLDKDIYVRNLKHNRQTNCFNLQMMCESLNVDGNDLGEEIFKELERYNRTYSKAYIRNGKNWTDLKAFFVACEKAKEVLGNKNPRVFFNISKFFFMLSKQTLNSANIKLDYVNLRSQFELMYIDARNSNFDVIIQPVTTVIRQGAKGEEYETLMMSKYINNFPLHDEMRFDHEHHVFGVVSGLAARTSSRGEFGKIKSYYYQFRLLDLLKNEYGYLNLDIEIGEGIEQPVLINNKQIAHKVLLKKKKITSNFSGFTKTSAKLMLGKDKMLPESKYIYDYENPIELSPLIFSEINYLLESEEAIIVYLIDETLYDSYSIYDNNNALSNLVVEKGEIFYAKYNLFSVTYSQKNPRATSIIDYARYLFPGYRNKQLDQIKSIRLFDSLTAQQKNAIIRTEQAEIALRELKKSNDLIKELNSSLQDKVAERTAELEQITEQKTNTFINLAHETKTPLTLINNYLQEYTGKYGENEELKIIKNNIGKLTKDIVNFFDIERINKGFYLYNHDQITNFSKLLNENIGLFKHFALKKDILLYDSIECGIFIKADPQSLFRIINNLIENAIKYTKENGSITIELKSEDRKIYFSVKDNGIGIPVHLHSKIFEPYYQINSEKGNFQGMGIGLSIVRKITEGLNGQISLVSDPGKQEGTKIIIELDKYELKGNESVTEFINNQDLIINVEKLEAKDEVLDNERSTIMIIEDNIGLINYLASKLKEKYNLYVATSGNEALEKLKTINTLDLIISDVMMDNGNGLEFYKEISKQKKYRHLPLIFITAKNSIEDKLEALSLGAVDYIHKPFLIGEVISKIDSLLKNIQMQRNALIDTAYRTIMVNEYKNSFEENCAKYNLTSRETEIVRLLAKGITQKLMADELHISDKTVAKHVQNIFEKVEVNNKVELLNKLGINLNYANRNN